MKNNFHLGQCICNARGDGFATQFSVIFEIHFSNPNCLQHRETLVVRVALQEFTVTCNVSGDTC